MPSGPEFSLTANIANGMAFVRIMDHDGNVHGAGLITLICQNGPDCPGCAELHALKKPERN